MDLIMSLLFALPPMLLALVVFVIAALGGLVMALRVLNGHLAPWALSLLHAGLGAAGLGLLLLATMAGAGGFLGLVTLGILLVAALGGFFLASIHLRNNVAPAGIVILHATLAVVGVVMLVAVVFLFDVSPDLTDHNALAPQLRGQ